MPRRLEWRKGYRAEWIDIFLLDLGNKAAIPSKANEDCGEHFGVFDKRAFGRSNIVERFIRWLKESHREFSRYEKKVVNFRGMITLFFIQQ